ncbi:MAG: ankyrin repeat domain-containing protein [Bdellovibrionales bacterium]|nr:ankyrin repeat domain-containing protein [Bdellovibrionales bacterium]
MIKKIFFIQLLILSILSCRHEQSVYNSKDHQRDKESKIEDPNVLIFKAIAEGDVTSVEKYLKQGIDINIKGEAGQTLVIAAVKGNKYHLIDFLMQKGADPEIKDDYGKSAIDYATELNNEVVLKVLNKEELSPEVLGMLLMERAVNELKVDLVKWLLEKGADPNFTIGRNNSLTKLISRGRVNVEVQVEIANLLVQHPNFTITERMKNKLINLCETRYDLPEIAEILKKI